MKLKKYSFEKNDALSRKLKSYSALTGAFLAAGAAQGQIIYTDVNPDALIQNATYDVDMDNDGTFDLSILHAGSTSTNGVGIVGTANQFANKVIGKVGASSYFYPSRLNAGAPIGPAVPDFLSIGAAPSNLMTMALYFTGGNYGYWGNGSGYLGVQFTTGANTYYGWIECTVAQNATSVTIKGYAYESTPATLINAGDTASVSAINELPSINSVGNFYPNAARNGKTFINIDAKEFSELNLEIINGMGQVMQTGKRKLIAGKNIVQLNVNSLESGTYFVKLMQGDKSFFRKVMVSK